MNRRLFNFDFFLRLFPDYSLKLREIYQSRNDVYQVFGVILYTNEHPYVKKMLRDDDFWKSLDSISGKRWPIFAIRPKAGATPPRKLQTRGYGFLNALPGYEPEENWKLVQEFGIKNTTELPMLIVFAEISPGDILQMQCRFSANSKDECYASLKTILEKAAGAVENVTKENVGNTEEVFRLIQNELQQYIVFQRIKKAISIVQWVKSLFGIFSK